MAVVAVVVVVAAVVVVILGAVIGLVQVSGEKRDAGAGN